MRQENKIAAISQALLHHNYNLIILDGLDYQIRDIGTDQIQWDFENSNVPLKDFDVEGFLDIVGRLVH